jgi:starvation-inducible DNA-binding protein
MQKQMMPVNIGIAEKERKDIADGLGRLLADTFSLYLKTHAFHWNVTGPMFQTLHLMFEEQYNELWLATDAIAERIRALGSPVHATYTDFTAITSIKETSGVPEATEMVRLLLEGHETVIRTTREIFPKADDVHDEATADLLTQRMQIHEKTAWMLRSLIS